MSTKIQIIHVKAFASTHQEVIIVHVLMETMEMAEKMARVVSKI